VIKHEGMTHRSGTICNNIFGQLDLAMANLGKCENPGSRLLERSVFHSVQSSSVDNDQYRNLICIEPQIATNFFSKIRFIVGTKMLLF
jgi:hypothetical protein